MDNKGFSLIEMLVAITIGSVILLLVSFMMLQGNKLFTRESDNVNIRNDYQIVRNQIEQAIMEAKTIVVVQIGNDYMIYTGEVDTTNNKLKVEGTADQTTERVITFKSATGKIYMSNSYEQATAEGNMLCSEVTHFSISFDEKCKKTREKDGATETYYTNPLIVNLELDLEIKESNMDSTIAVKVRNVLKNVEIYKPTDWTQYLGNVTTVEQYKVR